MLKKLSKPRALTWMHSSRYPSSWQISTLTKKASLCWRDVVFFVEKKVVLRRLFLAFFHICTVIYSHLHPNPDFFCFLYIQFFLKDHPRYPSMKYPLCKTLAHRLDLLIPTLALLFWTRIKAWNIFSSSFLFPFISDYLDGALILLRLVFLVCVHWGDFQGFYWKDVKKWYYDLRILRLGEDSLGEMIWLITWSKISLLKLFPNNYLSFYFLN